MSINSWYGRLTIFQWRVYEACSNSAARQRWVRQIGRYFALRWVYNVGRHKALLQPLSPSSFRQIPFQQVLLLVRWRLHFPAVAFGMTTLMFYVSLIISNSRYLFSSRMAFVIQRHFSLKYLMSLFASLLANSNDESSEALKVASDFTTDGSKWRFQRVKRFIFVFNICNASNPVDGQ